MAQFYPDKKEAEDFNNGFAYIDGDGTLTGDFIHAEAINDVIEGMLYAQDRADFAVNTALNAQDLVNSVVTNAYAPPPVGMHHIQFNGEPAPASIWASTSWEIDTTYQGRTIIGSGGSYTLGATGGSADSVVIEHTHTVQLNIGSGGIAADGLTAQRGYLGSYTKQAASVTSVGVSGVGKNMPPYAVVNVWKRTA